MVICQAVLTYLLVFPGGHTFPREQYYQWEETAFDETLKILTPEYIAGMVGKDVLVKNVKLHYELFPCLKGPKYK